MKEKNNPVKGKELLEKYLRQECTTEEELQVLQWFYTLNQEKENYNHQSLEELPLKINNKINQKLFGDSEASKRMPNSFFKYLSAACIIFLLGFSSLFFFKKSYPTIKSEIEVASIIPISGIYGINDINPGQSFAKIKTSEGTEHVLSDSLNHSFSNNIIKEGEITIEVPSAGKFKVILEDGTKVWLNSISQLSYPEKFESGKRIVSLDGEAYFEVKKDKNRPFIIQCRGAEIEVLGTSFNVSTYGDSFSTSLLEGSVKITKDNESNILKPGEIAKVIDNKIEITSTDLDKDLAWHRGEFYFNGESFQEILDEIGRWYNVSFEIRNTNYSFSNFAGTISRETKLSEVLKILEATTVLKFSIQNRVVIVQ